MPMAFNKLITETVIHMNELAHLNHFYHAESFFTIDDEIMILVHVTI